MFFYSCFHLQGSEQQNNAWNVWKKRYSQMPFLTQSGLEPVALGLQDHVADRYIVLFIYFFKAAVSCFIISI